MIRRQMSRCIASRGCGDGDLMITANVNGIAMGIESFGDDDAPLVLFAVGTTMASWPDALSEGLAADVVLRPAASDGFAGSGSSISVPST